MGKYSARSDWLRYDDRVLIVLLPLLAFAASLLAHELALWLFPRLRLLDFPERYGLSRPRLPYPTGILPALLFLAFFLVLAPWDLKNLSIVVAILLLAATSFLDDLRPLPATARLTVQIGLSLLIFASGSRIYSLSSPLPSLTQGGIIALDGINVWVPLFGILPVVSGLFTVVWLGLTINALNWFDGIPGQVSVLATIGFLTIGSLALSPRVDQPDVGLLALVLAGLSAGGLLFDLPPPRLLMGDTGAMFYGLMLGVLTIYAGGKVATAFLVLGVPLTDFVIVATRRVLRGCSPLRSGEPGTEHLHHRLLRAGWKPEQVILLTAGIGTAFGVTALFLDTRGKFIAALLLFLLMVGLSRYAGSKSRNVAG